jgi:riboflavin kinase/FMN adenylyltransferase
MQLVRHLARVEPAARAPVVACGRFDGVHRGHQQLLEHLSAAARAHRTEAVVALCRPPSPDAVLTSLRQQLDLFAARGVDRVVLLGRSDPRDASALATRLAAAALVTAGGTEPSPGWTVERIERVADGATVLTSAAVRSWLGAGDLTAVERALGRCHAVEGRVVHGFHRGAPLGIPTANLHVRRFALPPDGVYAVRVRRRGAALDGVANIGRNPTFGNTARSVETHLLDFAGDLYGERLEVAFVARLRGERTFSGVEALVAQIRADIVAARTVLAARGNGI